MDLSAEKDLAIEIARQTGEMLRTSHSRDVLSSIGKDIKMVADKEANRMIREFFELHSSIPLLSEEDEAFNFSESTMWVVDPLDGSLNYSRGFPICAVSIGFLKDGEPLLGVVYDFNRDEMFVGVVGEGATLNGHNISVSGTVNKGEGIMMTGFPSYTSFDDDSLKNYIKNVQTYKKIRNIGSAALSLAYVACGRADAYFEKDIKIWDVLAGVALVRAAGGEVTQSESGPSGKCEVFVTNGKL
jgi:Archaeal fructose-1,6-bisphosphatase and related enzymes of inositol monophosphatase family